MQVVTHRKSVMVRRSNQKETFVAGIYAQVSVTNSSRDTTFSVTLGDTEDRVTQALLSKHHPYIGTAVSAKVTAKDAIFITFLGAHQLREMNKTVPLFPEPIRPRLWSKTNGRM